MNTDFKDRLHKPTRKWVKNGGTERFNITVLFDTLRRDAIDELARRLTIKLRPKRGSKYKVNRSMIINDALDQYEPLQEVEQQLKRERGDERDNGEQERLPAAARRAERSRRAARD